MSRPDHTPRVAVDLAAPLPALRKGRRRVVFILVVTLAISALFVAVTQLLLR